MIAGIVFLFATPAYAYTVSLYQHHISAFIILLSILLVVRSEKKWLVFFSIWFLAAFSLMVDNPNLFLMFPIGLVALTNLITHRAGLRKITFGLRPIMLLSFVGAILPMAVFGIVNYYSYGNPFQLAGTVPYVARIDEAGFPSFPVDSEFTIDDLASAGSQSTIGFFNTRNFVNGLYIHLLSEDRGVIFFTPVILFGVLGAYVLYKKNTKHLPLLLSIVLVNLILYSMWGDPWGGWGFGSRYLIPSYAIMAIFIPFALTKFSNNKIFVLVFSILLVYSISVNTLGAITTSASPPKIQAIPLEQITGKHEKYSWDRNWEYLNTNGSKSFFFREYASEYVDARTFYLALVGALCVMSMGIMLSLYSGKRKNKWK